MVQIVLIRPVPAHPSPSVVATFEHVRRGHRVQRPVAAFSATHVVVHAGPAPRYLDETVVQAQVVPDGVLPALSIPPVIRELLRDVIVYLAQRHPLVGRGRDGHGDQRYVRVRRFLVASDCGHVHGCGHSGALLDRLIEQVGCRHLQNHITRGYKYIPT